MSDADMADPKLRELRQHAIDRATALLSQLQADHAGLLHHQRQYETPGGDLGIDTVARVIESTKRVRSLLQGG